MFNKTMAETGGVVFEGVGMPKEGALAKLKRFFHERYTSSGVVEKQMRNVEKISGELTQDQREQAMKKLQERVGWSIGRNVAHDAVITAASGVLIYKGVKSERFQNVLRAGSERWRTMAAAGGVAGWVEKQRSGIASVVDKSKNWVATKIVRDSTFKKAVEAPFDQGGTVREVAKKVGKKIVENTPPHRSS